MNIDSSCSYCQGPEAKAEVLAAVGALTYSFLYVPKDQFHRGRCVLAAMGHYEELHEMEPVVYAGFMEDARRVALAINKLFSPDKINYALYGDTVRHVHMHLVPKYKELSDWSAPFLLKPSSVPDERYKDVVALLQKELSLN